MPCPPLPQRDRTGVCSPSSRRPQLQAPVIVFGSAVVGLLALAACSTPGQVTCPENPPATNIRVDASETSRSDVIRADHLSTIGSELELTPLCHGTISVDLFSSGTGATVNLFDSHVAAEGATMPARQRKLDEAVEPVMEQIVAGWPEAEASLPADGTDVVGQLDLLAEYFAQHPDSSHRGLILTDGVQTTGSLTTNVGSFTEAVADELAQRVSVPDLTGAEITIAGVGRVAAGDPPPSDYVSALKTFYRIVCERTGAQCLVVTDLAADRTSG